MKAVATATPQSERRSSRKNAASAPAPEFAAVEHSEFGSVIHRKASCSCGGDCPTCQAKSNLNISHPNDPAELEADAIADNVMQMPDSQIVKKDLATASPTLPPPSSDNAEGSFVNRATFSGGRPLDVGTRDFFEARLKSDLSNVRVHTDSTASHSADTINAQAYTFGNNIVFGNGEYSPDTRSGKRLIAHELAHVQQRRNNPSQNVIHRQPKPQPQKTTDPKPATQPVKDSIGVNVVVDKDCTGMTDGEYKDYALLLFINQIFGIDRVKGAAIIKSNGIHWLDFTVTEKEKKLGAVFVVSVKKDFYRSTLADIYGSDAPFIDQMVDALYTSSGVKTEKDLKEQSKQRQYEDLKGKLSPLDIEYIKTKYKLIEGTSIDKKLEDIRKAMADLAAAKKNTLAWFKFLKTQLSPVAFYHRIAAEFVRLESLFQKTFLFDAMYWQMDPLNWHYKTDMAAVHKQYPWFKKVETDLKTEWSKYPSPDDRVAGFKQELAMNGFKDEKEYREFGEMFVGAFQDVAASKIEAQLKVSEEIVQKEQKRYSSGDLSEIQDFFKPWRSKLKYVEDEMLKLSNRQEPYDNLDNQQVMNAYHQMEAHQKELNGQIAQKRKDYSYAYPILADETLENKDLLVDDSAILKFKLLQVTAKRQANITKTRENLKKNPEKFVFMVADKLYAIKAKQELMIDDSSLENFFIDGRITKMQADQSLEHIALAALTIGLGLISLPFTGTAAALASVPGFVLGIYTSVEEVKEYRMRVAAAGTSFDVKDAILKEEPSLFWLVVGLAGTALDGFIITKTFSKLAKSRYLKYGRPERKFLEELETTLKEAGLADPDQLKAVVKAAEKEVAAVEELNSKIAGATSKVAAATAKVAKVAAKTDLAVIDNVAEAVYWAMRRGIKTSDDLLKEAKGLEKIDKALIDDCFKELAKVMPDGKGLSVSEFQEVLGTLYKNNGYEVFANTYVINEKTGKYAYLTAVKKADGKYEFLEMSRMTDEQRLIIDDIKKGEKSLRLKKGSPLKDVNLDQVRALGVPTKVLSDLPEVQKILQAVEEIDKPLNALRRQARKLREELEQMSGLASPNQTLVATKTQQLADAQKGLADQGKKLLAEADKLEKEAALVTDKVQKSNLKSQVSDLRGEAEMLGYDIKVQDAYRLRSNLRKILDTAKRFGANAVTYEAHHLIPVELIELSPVVRKAIEGGFDFNGLINGINLTQFSSKFRTQNIIVELIDGGKSAFITEGLSARRVTVEVAADGKNTFKIGDQTVGELTYTRELKTDGTIIESGKVSLTKDTGIVSESIKESPFGIHASHPSYTAYVTAELDTIAKKFPAITPQQARQEVETLVNGLRSTLESAMKTPGFKIDEYFKNLLKSAP